MKKVKVSAPGKEKILKATAVSPANIPFIKYWGQRDPEAVLPMNNSISMNLSNCQTTTTVCFSSHYKKDEVKIKFYGQRAKRAQDKQLERVLNQVNRFREMRGVNWPVKVYSENSFPSDSGIASSASAFSALTVALADALGLKLSKKKLSILTRLAGSGSACRSIINGFAEWKKGNSSQTSYAIQLADEEYWALADIVVVVSSQIKEVSSLNGHQLAPSSPYFQTRLRELPKRIKNIKKALLKRDFKLLGEIIEEEAISMHVVCMTSNPPIFYWNGTTMEIINSLREWRSEGLLGYFTMDAGPNVHVICQKNDSEILNAKLKRIPGVEFTIINQPCKGARIINSHLF